jgi:hypothetical protein
MKHNMNEETLMAYLYGESNAEERERVEKYFSENPGELQKYKELLFVRNAMSKVEDKEVIAPPIFMDDEKPVISLWRSGFVRYSAGIAAAFVIVMIGAKLLGLQMSYSGNQFTLSFGAPAVKEANTGLSPEQVQAMISSALSQNNQAVQASWDASQTRMKETLQQNVALTSQKIDEITKSVASASQEEIRQYMQSLRSENNQIVQDYIRLSSNDQKQYIESLLVDFSKYMQEQRNQDLNVLSTRLNTLEEDNTLFRQEAGQILTSLISDNNSSLKRN